MLPLPSAHATGCQRPVAPWARRDAGTAPHGCGQATVMHGRTETQARLKRDDGRSVPSIFVCGRSHLPAADTQVGVPRLENLGWNKAQRESTGNKDTNLKNSMTFHNFAKKNMRPSPPKIQNRCCQPTTDGPVPLSMARQCSMQVALIQGVCRRHCVPPRRLARTIIEGKAICQPCGGGKAYMSRFLAAMCKRPKAESDYNTFCQLRKLEAGGQ